MNNDDLEPGTRVKVISPGSAVRGRFGTVESNHGTRGYMIALDGDDEWTYAPVWFGLAELEVIQK